MGQINNANDAVAQDVRKYVKPTLLIQLKAIFCIHTLVHKNGKFGPQWTMQIEVDSETAKFIEGADENNRVYMSMQDSDGSRDRMLQYLLKKGNFPVHSATFSPLKLDSGTTYYGLAEVEGYDPCAMNESEVEGEIDDLDNIEVEEELPPPVTNKVVDKARRQSTTTVSPSTQTIRQPVTHKGVSFRVGTDEHPF